MTPRKRSRRGIPTFGTDAPGHDDHRDPAGFLLDDVRWNLPLDAAERVERVPIDDGERDPFWAAAFVDPDG